jgi:aminopeptidase N
MHKNCFLCNPTSRLLSLANAVLFFFAFISTTSVTFANSGSVLSLKEEGFSHADSLRGALRPERTCFDVTYYHLDLTVDPVERDIQGSNRMVFNVLANTERLQIDLFENMAIDRIVDRQGGAQPFVREGNAVFVQLDHELTQGSVEELTVFYGGKPIVAKNAPWDGGFTWKEDEDGNPWIGVSCEGIGASLWWPNKDHPSDEPDSMLVSVRVPQDLVFVGNGQLRHRHEAQNGYVQYDWFVSYPINNYNISLNIGNYIHFSDTFSSIAGQLPLDYYVLKPNLEKAKAHFEQVKPMFACYEQYFEPYPFFNDGYALVETPYLGMEHQGAIAYGNKFKTGYSGYDISRIGMTFDYIIIHESGHEWWGNSITAQDMADLWIHEGFCTYAEALYVECMFDYETAMQYVNAKKPSIENDKPIIGPYDVNGEGSGDMYDKGMLLLNTLRHISLAANGSDDRWFEAIKGLTADFERTVVTSATVEQYMADKLGLDLNAFWDQYLRQTLPPRLEIRILVEGKKTQLQYRWEAEVPSFAMPIRFQTGDDSWKPLTPNTEWQTLDLGKVAEDQIKFDMEHYYFLLKK